MNYFLQNKLGPSIKPSIQFHGNDGGVSSQFNFLPKIYPQKYLKFHCYDGL